MITNDGKVWLKRYLASGGRSLASSMAVGLNNTAEVVTSTRLDLEVARVGLDIISYDFVNNRLVFKATLPTELEATIYEIGLFTYMYNTLAYGFGSRTLVKFNQTEENWSGATWSTSTYRLGLDSLQHSLAASGTSTATLTQPFSLGGYSSTDRFLIGANLSTTNVASLRYRFLTDSTNYYDIIVNTGFATGYKVYEVAKGAATATGSPNWDTIAQLQVTATASAGGAVVVNHDALRIEDVDTVNPDYLMFARTRLTTPIVKKAGVTREIEYGVPITI